MSTKVSAETAKVASAILGRMDQLAAHIMKRHASWGMSKEAAKEVVNGLDAVADNFERGVFGSDSLAKRQVEVLKQAKVIQQDPDEGYMATFNAPFAPIQTDGDEPYMSAYGVDQSNNVETGKSTTGRPLAP